MKSVITNKQQEILKHLYRYRFADSRQIEVLMHHKDRRRIGAWLKDLREKQYIGWIYSNDFEKKTKPAIYYLAINGIRFMASLHRYPVKELRKRYRESSRQEAFISNSLLIVECVIHFEICNANSENLNYVFKTRADYLNPEDSHYALSNLGPDIFVEKQIRRRGKYETTNYLIKILDSGVPRYVVRKQLKEYVTYLAERSWRRRLTGPEPIVHIICKTKVELIYAKRRTRRLLDDISEEDDIHIRFATIDEVRQYGVTGAIWEAG
jgi:protein involved in plasmid replication-relaxation